MILQHDASGASWPPLPSEPAWYSSLAEGSVATPALSGAGCSSRRALPACPGRDTPRGSGRHDASNPDLHLSHGSHLASNETRPRLRLVTISPLHHSRRRRFNLSFPHSPHSPSGPTHRVR